MEDVVGDPSEVGGAVDDHVGFFPLEELDGRGRGEEVEPVSPAEGKDGLPAEGQGEAFYDVSPQKTVAAGHEDLISQRLRPIHFHTDPRNLTSPIST